MKITCQSCQAKYTIADEKVVGKTVKIKCKKCGAAIVVNANDPGAADAQGHGHDDEDDGATRVFGNEGGPPAGGSGGGDEWTVNVSDDDQRTMSSAQIASAFAAGTVSNDTYVWKDGMSDWLPLSQVAELMSLVNSGGGGASAPAAVAAPTLGSTVVMEESAPVAAQPAAAAGRGGATAARKGAGGSGGRAGQDLFGTGRAEDPAAASGKTDSKAVGERNENSVLFSLSALTAAEKSAAKDDVATKKKDARSGLDDIMNLGGGSLGGPMLAPPPLMAPVIEAPPPPMMQQMLTGTQMPLTGTQMPLTGTQVPQVVMVQVPEQRKSSAGLIIGIVLGVVVAGAAAFFLVGQKPSGTTTTENTTTTATPTTTGAPTTTAPTPTDTVAANPQPGNTGAATPNPADTKAGTTGGGPGPVAGTGGGGIPKPGNTGTAPAATTAAPVATPTATAEAPPAEGGKEFNRGAASSALGAAAGAAKSCKTPDGPTGTGKVKVTFAPSGNVTSAQVQGPPFAGTSVGGCVAGVFRGARVSPFDGSPVSVTKSFTIN